MESKTKKLAFASVLCAIGVVGSIFSIPVFGSKCAPVQHIVNIICAIMLGPRYGVGVAFVTSLLRNLLGLGSILAFPGSMFGALLCGLVYRKTKRTSLTYSAEVIGTAVVGGLSAYPLAILFIGEGVGQTTFYVFVLPFFISTLAGALIAALFIETLKKQQLLKTSI